MKRYRFLFALSIISLVGCVGSSTGNPNNGDNPDTGLDVVAPLGVELLMSDAPRETDPQVSDDDAEKLGSGNREFAFDLYQVLTAEDENLFFSPFSISIALAMSYAGAEGTTEEEMASALHFTLPEPQLHTAFNATDRALKGRADELADDSTGQGFQLSIVNQAWGLKDYPYVESYLDVLAANYGAGLFVVDVFGEPTRKIINDWVFEQTMERIEELLPPDSLTVDTRFVLTNAIYFKANWLVQFEESGTQDGTFHAAAAERTVPMMHQSLDARYTEGTDFQAVELPYLSRSVRMLIVLPAEGQFDSVAAGMNDGFFQQLLSHLSQHSTGLTMPRFSFEFEQKLKPALTQLGMEAAFKDYIADFSGLSEEEPLVIDEVYHKAFVAVDEQGTEAAAATAVVINWIELATPSAEIVLDRPFIFVIYDEPTGQILFLGHLKDPVE